MLDHSKCYFHGWLHNAPCENTLQSNNLILLTNVTNKCFMCLVGNPAHNVKAIVYRNNLTAIPFKKHKDANKCSKLCHVTRS